MNIETVPSEIIASEDYQPTQHHRVFIDTEGHNLVIVGQDSATKIDLPE